jgi:hypothetical protein
MQAIRPAVKKKAVKSPICVFIPIVVSPGPSTNAMAKPAAADSGSKVHRNAELSRTKPIDADINLAIIIFPSYLNFF